MKNLAIKDWAEDDRPREKLINRGVDALSNSELLAIIIKYGTQERSALELAKDLLAASKNDLHQLACMSARDIVNLNIKGLGIVKAITIVAALELATRRKVPDHKKISVTKSCDIADYLKTKLQDKCCEEFAVLFLNRQNKVNHFEIISSGGLTSTVVDIRIVMKKAVEHNATSIILCHNHPSGNLKPSANDQILTQKIKEAATLFDIMLLDHIIVSNEGYYSFADNDLLNSYPS